MQFYLGYAYVKIQDYAKATKLFTKSANLGNKFAQYNLEGMYHTGQGAPRNTAKAKQWFTKACENGLEITCQYR